MSRILNKSPTTNKYLISPTRQSTNMNNNVRSSGYLTNQTSFGNTVPTNILNNSIAQSTTSIACQNHPLQMNKYNYAGTARHRKNTSSVATLSQSMHMSTANLNLHGQCQLEINELKKELRQKENDLEKETALLEQKVAFLEMQVKEGLQREENMKRMHKTVLQAIQNDQDTLAQGEPQRTPREVRVAYEMHLKETEQLKVEFEQVKSDLKQKIATKDSEIRDNQIKMESAQIENQRREQELQLDKKELQNQIKRLQHDKNQLELEIDGFGKQQLEITKLQRQLDEAQQDKRAQQHKTDEYIKQLKDQKSIKEVEIQEQERKQETLIKRREMEFQEQLQEQIRLLQEKHQIQLEKCQEEIQLHQDHLLKVQDELQTAISEKCQEQDKSSKLERQLTLLAGSTPASARYGSPEDNFIATNRSQQLNLESQKVVRLLEENEYLTQQIGKLNSNIKDYRDEIDKQQENERVLRKEIQSLLTDIDNQRLEFQKKINQERDKTIQIENEFSDLRSKLSQQKNQLLEQINEKEETILKQKQEMNALKSNNQELIMQQHSPIHQQMNNSITASREFQLIASNNFAMSSTGMKNAQSQSPMGGHLNNNAIQMQASPKFLVPFQQQTTNLDNSASCQSNLWRNKTTMLKQVQDQHKMNLSMQRANKVASRQSNMSGSHGNHPLAETTTVNNTQLQQQGYQKIRTAELRLFQSCQRMVDAASHMQCSQCGLTFTTTSFCDHIISTNSECFFYFQQRNGGGGTIQPISQRTSSLVNNKNGGASTLQQKSQQSSTNHNHLISKHDEEYTLCLEEDSVNNPIIFESQNNAAAILPPARATATSTTRDMPKQMQNVKLHNLNLPPANLRDKFTLTNGSQEFKNPLDTSNTNISRNKAAQQLNQQFQQLNERARRLISNNSRSNAGSRQSRPKQDSGKFVIVDDYDDHHNQNQTSTVVAGGKNIQNRHKHHISATTNSSQHKAPSERTNRVLDFEHSHNADETNHHNQNNNIVSINHARSASSPPIFDDELYNMPLQMPVQKQDKQENPKAQISRPKFDLSQKFALIPSIAAANQKSNQILVEKENRDSNKVHKEEETNNSQNQNKSKDKQKCQPTKTGRADQFQQPSKTFREEGNPWRNRRAKDQNHPSDSDVDQPIDGIMIKEHQNFYFDTSRPYTKAPYTSTKACDRYANKLLKSYSFTSQSSSDGNFDGFYTQNQDDFNQQPMLQNQNLKQRNKNQKNKQNHINKQYFASNPDNQPHKPAQKSNQQNKQFEYIQQDSSIKQSEEKPSVTGNGAFELNSLTDYASPIAMMNDYQSVQGMQKVKNSAENNKLGIRKMENIENMTVEQKNEINQQVENFFNDDGQVSSSEVDDDDDDDSVQSEGEVGCDFDGVMSQRRHNGTQSIQANLIAKQEIKFQAGAESRMTTRRSVEREPLMNQYKRDSKTHQLPVQPTNMPASSSMILSSDGSRLNSQTRQAAPQHSTNQSDAFPSQKKNNKPHAQALYNNFKASEVQMKHRQQQLQLQILNSSCSNKANVNNSQIQPVSLTAQASLVPKPSDSMKKNNKSLKAATSMTAINNLKLNLRSISRDKTPQNNTSILSDSGRQQYIQQQQNTTNCLPQFQTRKLSACQQPNANANQPLVNNHQSSTPMVNKYKPPNNLLNKQQSYSSSKQAPSRSALQMQKYHQAALMTIQNRSGEKKKQIPKPKLNQSSSAGANSFSMINKQMNQTVMDTRASPSMQKVMSTNQTFIQRK